MSFENKTVVQKDGLGLPLLTAVFVVLKALGYIDWSWWLVFIPLWGPFAAIIGFLLGVLILGYSADKIGDWRFKRTMKDLRSRKLKKR